MAVVKDEKSKFASNGIFIPLWVLYYGETLLMIAGHISGPSEVPSAIAMKLQSASLSENGDKSIISTEKCTSSFHT